MAVYETIETVAHYQTGGGGGGEKGSSSSKRKVPELV